MVRLLSRRCRGRAIGCQAAVLFPALTAIDDVQSNQHGRGKPHPQQFARDSAAVPGAGKSKAMSETGIGPQLP